MLVFGALMIFWALLSRPTVPEPPGNPEARAQGGSAARRRRDQLDSVASTLICTPPRAREIGQFFAAPCAACSNAD